ncbi:MAG: hypothetical protein JWN35_3531 [Frankiales bacterium]|nr:hypothetical protein [Frankiales bacterium]
MSHRPARRPRSASLGGMALGISLLATGCAAAGAAEPAHSGDPASPPAWNAFAPPTADDRRRATALAGEACGHGTTAPLAAVPPGSGQTSLVTYDLMRLHIRRAAILGGQAAAQDPQYSLLAATARDLQEMYETARLAFSEALRNTATAEERRSLRELQAVAAQTAVLLNRACSGMP